MSKSEYDYDKLFMSYEECRSDNTAHFLKILDLQKEIERLKTELTEKDASLEFYADPENWINYQHDTWSRGCPKSHGDEEIIRHYKHKYKDWIGTVVVGGKRAREVLQKYKQSEK